VTTEFMGVMIVVTLRLIENPCARTGLTRDTVLASIMRRIRNRDNCRNLIPTDIRAVHRI